MKSQQVQSYDIPLHDIKPIIDVNEYSLYYFLAISFISLFLILSISYLIYKWLKNKNKYNKKREHYKLIHSVDLTKTKDAAYAITLYGATFKDDSDRHLEMYNNLIYRLELYKYKKNVDLFDKEVLGYINLYKDMIDV
ncbi:MAG: hypothetical protein COB17_09160 [Sulfurimonas sp.]|nr:MAG: hypothetical protein COB17_09160 [Sulfurimonas sp.]